jgi:hypothetical protein
MKNETSKHNNKDKTGGMNMPEPSNKGVEK